MLKDTVIFNEQYNGQTAQTPLRERFLPEGPSFPLVVEDTSGTHNAAQWVADNAAQIDQQLKQYGAILLRGFNVQNEDDFREVANEFIPTLAKYMEGATPRTNLGKGAYTSTEFPNELSIAQHNELSYIKQWPMKIAFSCMIPAQERGATPIADVRKVHDFIDADIKAKFEEHGWMLVRNYGNGLGPTWQKAFNTDDIEEVKAYCQQADVELEILSADQIRTRQVRPAIREHIHTGEKVWFNHAAFWHPSSLCPVIRKELVSQFGEEALTYNTMYGDGSVIPDEVIEHINEAYKKATVTFLWEKGDVLLMDNMLVSHGRDPFKGERRVVVSMGEPVEL
ncbi:TauD/TfdA family dioxygenase [Pseudoalteromonas viridis]|uniref:TauD/TfdA family dioxygenase n=1 Tax=Pseudoalteromonas viridis TaxID=339617 RepID=A0ABX7VAK9_9GAMM|nr:TauD/TfdA family dioxygenase [Pseudoalteromonas viridis]QTL36472.1 TauD/TfdA family dioxygenase [Pseudoalteromonas viridis]